MSRRTGSARLGLLVLATAALAPLAEAGVIVVDPAGGDGSALLQAALDDATNGDIVVVRAGTYALPASERYVVAGGVTLVADADSPPLPRASS